MFVLVRDPARSLDAFETRGSIDSSVKWIVRRLILEEVLVPPHELALPNIESIDRHALMQPTHEVDRRSRDHATSIVDRHGTSIVSCTTLLDCVVHSSASSRTPMVLAEARDFCELDLSLGRDTNLVRRPG